MRLKKIAAEIPVCKTLADVGCDHGYLSEYALRGGKCEKVYFTDISAKCLDKARALLKNYCDEGKAQGFVTDGLKGVPRCDAAIIAGMGGEEIVKIIEGADFHPEKLLLQPMRSAEKLRRFLVEVGYFIEKDFTFKDGDKFYDLIAAKKGKDELSDDEAAFGKDNVKFCGEDFKEKLRREKAVLTAALGKEPSESSLRQIKERLERIEKYV